MSYHDRCCDNDGTVKLVEYTIVSIKPCEEKVFHRGQVIYSDDMNDDAFATWVVARYFQGDDDIDAGHWDAGSHKDEDEDKREERRKRREISSADKRYLRVYHRVLESWSRPDDWCNNRHLDVLRGIEKAIRGINLPS
jgi:hypothetical protein